MADYLLVVTKDGYGKRTSIDEFTKRHRGGKGVSAAKTEGTAVAATEIVGDSCEVIVTTGQGMAVRVDVGEISISGRGARGVRLIDVAEGDAVVSAVCVSCHK